MRRFLFGKSRRNAAIAIAAVGLAMIGADLILRLAAVQSGLDSLMPGGVGLVIGGALVLAVDRVVAENSPDAS